jgi:hypothetical protein
MIRTGKRSLPANDCKKAGLALGVDPAALIAITIAEKQEDASLRRGLLKLARAALPAAVLAVGLQVGPAPSGNATAQQPAACLLCKVLPPRRIRRRERRGVAYPKRIKPTVYRGLAGIPEIKPRFLLRSLSDTVSLHRDVA